MAADGIAGLLPMGVLEERATPASRFPGVTQVCLDGRVVDARRRDSKVRPSTISLQMKSPKMIRMSAPWFGSDG
jgi:hypothetical protein